MDNEYKKMAETMIDELGSVGIRALGHSIKKGESLEQAKVRILGDANDSEKKNRMMPPITLSVPASAMLRAIEASTDLESLEWYSKSSLGLSIAPGENFEDFKDRVKHKFISGSEYDPDDVICGRCSKPLNKNMHCKTIKCLGKTVKIKSK